MAFVKERLDPSRHGIHYRHCLRTKLITINEEHVSTAAVVDIPGVGLVGMLLDGCQKKIAATDGSGQVSVAAPGGDKGGEGRQGRVLYGAGGLEEDTEEGRWVELAEAAAEGRGGCHRAAPRLAGEGGTDERGEGGEAEEDLEQKVFGERVDGGGAGRA